ncbi:site-specific integrase [Bacillus sp. S13(2024)]|uniref:tyrosine-type recombinase/integrase n=1 Tax=Bacillus sp. S13(2024) TaxID=3162885 RepID=UPI003D1C55FC
MLTENVVKLNSNEIYEQIEKFLKKKAYRSENTKRSYEKSIKKFFEVIKKKEVHFLQRADVQITLDDIENFIIHMYDLNELKNKTINNYVTAVKELLRYLHSKKLVDDISFIDAKQIDRLPEVKNKYGVLSVDEVLQMAELAKEEREKGEIKRLLILFSLDTCIRQQASLNLKWTDFEEREDGILVRAVDKGNKDFRPKIANWFYQELLSLKKNDNGYVFDLTVDNIKGMMKRVREKMNFPKERNIVFHSIRKAGVHFQYRVTGDILQAKKAANHSNINVTMDYVEEEDYGVIGAVSTSGGIDINIIKEISHEDLLKVIDSCKKDLQLILALKINEMLNNN